MPEREILAVCKDSGGMNGIVPVVRILRKQYPVILIGNGKAAELLTTGEDQFETYESAEQALASHSNPLLLLTSMCSEGGVGRDLVPMLKGTCPTVALSDSWGTRLVDSWKDPRYRPDYMCVNDSLGVALNERAWPDFHSSVITGYPMFDRYAAVNQAQEKAATEVHSKLGLETGLPIVLFPCGIITRPGEVLQEIVKASQKSPKPYYFIPRLHPRTSPEGAAVWHQTLARYEKGYLIADSSACDMPSLIAASTLVLSDFSTVLIEAALCKKPAISVFYPECVRELFHQEFGELMTEPPVTALGCAAKAIDVNHLGELITSALLGGDDALGIRDNQILNFSADGRNAERVATFVESLLP